TCCQQLGGSRSRAKSLTAVPLAAPALDTIGCWSQSRRPHTPVNGEGIAKAINRAADNQVTRECTGQRTSTPTCRHAAKKERERVQLTIRIDSIQFASRRPRQPIRLTQGSPAGE